MAEGARASLPGWAGVWGSHSPLWGVIQWWADNFCIYSGCSVPHCLMYEIYMETCGQNAQNQVHPSHFGSGDVIAFEKSTNYGSIIQQDGTMAFLADEYYNYCQDILQSVRNQELERVEDLLTSFWKALPQDTVVLMALPEVCQLFKCYDVQMYKGIEDVLLNDFLEDVSIQHLKSVRLFSKKLKLWLLNALDGFPALLQISKLKEVTVFVKRLRRKTYLSNMAKTMRMVLENNRRVSLLKSDLQGIMEVSTKALASHRSSTDGLESMEVKCLSSLISLLGTSTDLHVFLNCLSSNLQTFVFQPSRSKEEFIRLAASFQLRWNFVLTTVSKAMTLRHRDSFGSWHLFHLLLLEYVTHILQSCLEEEVDDDGGNLKEMPPDDQSLIQPDQAPCQPPDSPLSQEDESPHGAPRWVMLKHVSQSQCPVGVSSVVLRVLGFLVDTATGNKLVQVLLEDTATKSTVKLSLPVGQEALITLNDGQKFMIHISDVPQSSENIHFRESSANK